MKKLLLALILLAAPAWAHEPPEKEYQIKNAICRATGWENCKEAPMPIVIYDTKFVKYFQEPGWFLYGLHMPWIDLIVVRTDISPRRQNETVVHEMVHHFYDETRPVAKTERCESEYLARFWTTKILSTDYDKTWWRRYNCENYRNAAAP